MNIQIQGIRYQVENDDEAMVREKFEKLERFLQKHDDETLVEVDLELVEETHNHKKDVFRVEATITKGGEIFRAEQTRRSLQNAVNDVQKKLSKEIRRKNDKKQSVIRRNKKKIGKVFGR